MNAELYNSLAGLLGYPEADFRANVARTRDAIGDCQSALGNAVALFADESAPLPVHRLQELFIQTFDLSPVCSLEMGWHLFGENYDRGLLLVKMRQHLRLHGIAETTELPDHLTNALRLLARMHGDAGAYFAEAIVLPALEKMLAAIRGKDNPYEHVLDAARLAIREEYPDIPELLQSPAVEPELRVLA